MVASESAFRYYGRWLCALCNNTQMRPSLILASQVICITEWAMTIQFVLEHIMCLALSDSLWQWPARNCCFTMIARLGHILHCALYSSARPRYLLIVWNVPVCVWQLSGSLTRTTRYQTRGFTLRSKLPYTANRTARSLVSPFLPRATLYPEAPIKCASAHPLVD